MAIQKFSVTGKQQLLLLGPSIVTVIALFGANFYFFDGKFTDRGFLRVLVFVMWFDTLPAIALHIQYLIKNYRAVLTIDTTNRQLKYKTVDQTFIYSFDDIKLLDYYRSYGKGSGVQSFSMYRYYKIAFRDGRVLDVSCLIIN